MKVTRIAGVIILMVAGSLANAYFGWQAVALGGMTLFGSTLFYWEDM